MGVQAVKCLMLLISSSWRSRAAVRATASITVRLRATWMTTCSRPLTLRPPDEVLPNLERLPDPGVPPDARVTSMATICFVFTSTARWIFRKPLRLLGICRPPCPCSYPLSPLPSSRGGPGPGISLLASLVPHCSWANQTPMGILSIFS